MKNNMPVAIALVVGMILGGIGGGVLCNQGYCGHQATATPEASATRIINAPSAGSASDATAVVRSIPTGEPTSIVRDAAGPIKGLAVIGDSTADEYRADNPRGGAYGNSTFNWVELLANERDVNLGAWGVRSDVRRGGYAFNWARSGATSQSMIESGQHTGVEKQIRAGDVSHVIIQIGINDFYYSDAAINIYQGTLTGEPLQQFLDGIIANVALAVQAVKAAGEDHVILAATQDYVSPAILPEVEEMLPDTEGRQAVVDAFAYLNEGLSTLADRERVPFFDFNAALQCELDARYDPEDHQYILVGGERISLTLKSDQPNSAFLGDEYAHPGTVLSGLIANLFINEMNDVFDAGLTPFSDEEILRIAGLQ